jgi:hypothetical protein
MKHTKISIDTDFKNNVLPEINNTFSKFTSSQKDITELLAKRVVEKTTKTFNDSPISDNNILDRHIHV